MTLDEMILEFKESADGQEQRLKGLREKDIHTYVRMKAAAKKLRLVEGWLKELKRLREESPQVIRCRDCGWWEKQADSLQGRCSLLGIYPTGSWYCANANSGIYPCDPEKNAECKKTDCYINGGPCDKTTRKECRIEE